MISFVTVSIHVSQSPYVSLPLRMVTVQLGFTYATMNYPEHAQAASTKLQAASAFTSDISGTLTRNCHLCSNLPRLQRSILVSFSTPVAETQTIIIMNTFVIV